MIFSNCSKVCLTVGFYDFIAAVMYLWWSGELVASEVRLLLFYLYTTAATENALGAKRSCYRFHEESQVSITILSLKIVERTLCHCSLKPH